MSDLRVAVVGTSGSGKTTMARRIAQACELPHVELDVLHWLPAWTQRSLPEFRRLVAEATAGSRWVVDGNYGKVRQVYWSRLTDVVWLRLPFPVIFWRVLRRTGRRVFREEEIFGGNRETLRKALFARDSILWWVITTHRRRQRQFEAMFRDADRPAFRLHEIRSDFMSGQVVEALRRTAAAPAAGRPFQ